MPLYQAIVLAIVQGLTEFLPVSSTAHLWLFPWLLGWKDPGLKFDVALHAGTLLAVLIYFWRYWVEMAAMGVGWGGGSAPDAGAASHSVRADLRQNPRLLWFLVVATLPAALAGWRFEHAAEEQLRSPVVIGAALIVVGLLMWAGDWLGKRERDLGHVGLLDSFLVGVAQALAVIPGVSRSGVTMTAGLFRSMKRETAARFSFLLSTPIIAGAALKKGLEIRHTGLPHDMRLPFLCGALVSALVGYLVIAVLIRYLERRTFKVFVVYRVALGVIVLVLGWGSFHG
ncbi:MAG: undecaprenyl-diphosphate phosphatase [Terriglobia bacterium]